jgi:hypothetical protein
MLQTLLAPSQMSDIETVQMIATFFSLTEPAFNCAACLIRYKKEHRDSQKGCNAPTSRVVAKYHSFFEFKRCPGALKSQAMREIIQLHRLWESGVLPYDGGVLDQPAKIVEAMGLVDSLKFEHQKDLEAKAKKWQKTKSQSNSRLNNKRP